MHPLQTILWATTGALAGHLVAKRMIPATPVTVATTPLKKPREPRTKVVQGVIPREEHGRLIRKKRLVSEVIQLKQKRK